MPPLLAGDGPAASPGQPAGEATSLEIASFIDKLLKAGETDLYRRVSCEMDRIVMTVVLRHANGNQVLASELLGISRTTLRAKLRALGIASERPTHLDRGAASGNGPGTNSLEPA